MKEVNVVVWYDVLWSGAFLLVVGTLIIALVRWFRTSTPALLAFVELLVIVLIPVLGPIAYLVATARRVRCHSVVATVLGGRGVACGAQDADGDGSGGDLHGSEGGVVGAQDRQAPRSLSVGDLAGDPAELDEDARVQDGYR